MSEIINGASLMASGRVPKTIEIFFMITAYRMKGSSRLITIIDIALLEYNASNFAVRHPLESMLFFFIAEISMIQKEEGGG